MTRANSPATKREQLFNLLCSRTLAHRHLTDQELGELLFCSARTVKRLRQWLKDEGRIPLPEIGPAGDTIAANGR